MTIAFGKSMKQPNNATPSQLNANKRNYIEQQTATKGKLLNFT